MKKLKLIIGVFGVLFLFSKISEGCDNRKRQDRVDQLNVHASELNSKYTGRYQGTIVSGFTVPSAGIYPEKLALAIDIGPFQPKLLEEVVAGSSGKSDHQQTNLDHLSAVVTGIWVSESGETMYSTPDLRFYPDTKVFCALSFEGSTPGSFFGGDICDIQVTEDYIQTPKGTLYRTK